MTIRKKTIKLTIITILVITTLAFTACDSSNGGDASPSIYANPDNWLNLPGEIQNEADVLFFYPTTYSPTNPDAPFISPLDDEVMRKYARLAFQVRATAFETVADIYAPFYQQVDFRKFEAGELINVQRDVARQSLFLALDYYFENYNNGRPYFLAGHSQGAAMMVFILDEYMKEHPDRYKSMVAAYMLGNSPTQDWLDENAHITFSEGADDTGVLISWNTEGPGNIGEYNLVVPDGAVAINPLNWRRDEIPAGVEENKGSLIPIDGNYKVVTPGIADARVDVERGSVIVESVDPSVFANSAVDYFGPQSYHSWDYEFFYMNIRENAALRLEHFLNK